MTHVLKQKKNTAGKVFFCKIFVMGSLLPHHACLHLMLQTNKHSGTTDSCCIFRQCGILFYSLTYRLCTDVFF
ncbi:hypothetical protein XELAEV_18022269mg [Xenopus laevis]|uniref:Uncharacterized protein n=1 Tax=Xenopus laevis TaxID=8355 RepID=A0A974D1X5_XENLA|nr:hypothetical protein XELAEV_18022269mg [Xenopus laevis]